MSLSLTDIQQIMADFENGSLRELTLDVDDVHLHLSKNETVVQVPVDVQTVDSEAPVEQTVTIKAPLVGTVYLAPKPDAAPYVALDGEVHAGDVVAIIESMKLMTEVKSTVTGIVTAVNVTNEAVVGYDDTLFTVVPF